MLKVFKQNGKIHQYVITTEWADYGDKYFHLFVNGQLEDYIRTPSLAHAKSYFHIDLMSDKYIFLDTAGNLC